MAERTLPTLFVNGVLGSHADDPGFVKVGLRVLAADGSGEQEIQVCVRRDQVDELIRALVTAKGFLDWPPVAEDYRHRVTETEVYGAVDADGAAKVLLRLFGGVANQSPGAPPPAGHLNFVLEADAAEALGAQLIEHAAAAKRSA